MDTSQLTYVPVTSYLTCSLGFGWWVPGQPRTGQHMAGAWGITSPTPKGVGALVNRPLQFVWVGGWVGGRVERQVGGWVERHDEWTYRCPGT